MWKLKSSSSPIAAIGEANATRSRASPSAKRKTRQRGIGVPVSAACVRASRTRRRRGRPGRAAADRASSRSAHHSRGPRRLAAAVRLFHYHLVTSASAEVEARYLGKLAFGLVARHGRIGEEYQSFEAGMSVGGARRAGLQASADRARAGRGQRRRPARPVGTAARRPSRAGARRGRVRRGDRPGGRAGAARPGARRPGDVHRHERRLPARGCRRASGSTSCSRPTCCN